MDNSALMASEEATSGEIEKNVSEFENPRQSGRRKTRSNESAAQNKNKKKLPGRGMGVAQLERMRLTPKNSLQSSPILHSHYLLPALYPDRMPSIVGGYGQLGLNHAFVLPRLGNGGLCTESGFTVSDQYRVDPYVFKEANPGLRGGNYLGETSKELSSIPNPSRYPGDDHCGICHKKKRGNGGSFGCNGMTDVDPYLINGCNFVGFNVGNKQYIHGINVDKGSVEVLGVHMKGSSSGAVMEYDFFPPGKGGRGTSTKDLDLSLFSSEASVAVLSDGGGIDHQGSCVTTTTTTTSIISTTGFDSSTKSVDLSLKLSY